MSDQPPIPILWRGHETVDEVCAQLRPGTDIELLLAEEYHHALFRALHPHAPPAGPEELDVAGGAELLDGLGQIRGLEGIESLVAPLRRVHAGVYITGRAKIAITVPEGAGADPRPC